MSLIRPTRPSPGRREPWDCVPGRYACCRPMIAGACRPRRWPRRFVPTAALVVSRSRCAPAPDRRTPVPWIPWKTWPMSAPSKDCGCMSTRPTEGFAALTPKGRAALAGIDRADSVTLDPHKWLFQPMECGSVLIRDGDRLEGTFAIHPDYLDGSSAHGPGEVNLADRGLQLSRGFRALKVWVSVQTFGLAAFRAAIQRNLELAELAEDLIRGYAGPHADGAGDAGDCLLPKRVARLRRSRDRASRQGPRRRSGAQRRCARLDHAPGGPARHQALRPQPDQLGGRRAAGYRALRGGAGLSERAAKRRNPC